MILALSAEMGEVLHGFGGETFPNLHDNDIIIAAALIVCACGETAKTAVVTDAASEITTEAIAESASVDEVAETETEQDVEEEADQVEFAGTLQILSESELRDVLGLPDVIEPNDTQEGSAWDIIGNEYGVVFFDEPQKMMLTESAFTLEPSKQAEYEVKLILLESDLIDGFRQYDGEHHIFSMDASKAYVSYPCVIMVDDDGKFYGPVEHGQPTAEVISVVE